jgi:elongation factor 1-gamma
LQTPALEDGEVAFFGAEAISKHLVGAGSTYIPQSAEVEQWLLWAEGHLLPNVLAYVLPSISAAHFEASVVDHAKRELLAQLKQFNSILLHKTYLVGERLSIADVSVALDLLPAYQHVLDTGVRNGIVNVNRWFLTVVNQPAVKAVVGEVHLIEKASTFNEEVYFDKIVSASKG